MKKNLGQTPNPYNLKNELANEIDHSKKQNYSPVSILTSNFKSEINCKNDNLITDENVNQIHNTLQIQKKEETDLHVLTPKDNHKSTIPEHLLDPQTPVQVQNTPQNNDWKFNTLVLSGGGIKGTAIIGSLVVLEEHGCLKNITCFSGTSIGALLCSLLSIGYTSKELSTTILNMNLNDLRDIDLFNFFTNFGLDTGKKIIEYLEDLFTKKDVDINITFEDLYTKYKKTLIITGTCVNEHKLDIFSHKTHPKCKIIEAVRISTSMPFLYSAPKYKNNYYSDGGILNNYPVQCLKGYVSQDSHILGIKLMHDFSLHGRVEINKYEFPKYAKHLVYTAMDEIHRLRNELSLYEDKFDNLVTIEIETEGFDSIPIELTQNDKKKLFSLGQHFTACRLEDIIDKQRNY